LAGELIGSAEISDDFVIQPTALPRLWRPMSSKEAGSVYLIQGERLAHSIAVQLRALKKNGNN
jgi:hypothetical protein